MPRRLSIAGVACLALLALAADCREKTAQHVFPGAPVILISIDTLRADRLPAYGYSKVETPHLDRLAADSWLFLNAYAPAPMTLPSHTTMLTGMLPPEHGVRNNSGFVFDGRSHESLPRFLKRGGYATGAAVSSYVLRSETGLGKEFDFYEDSVGVTPGVAAVHYQRSGDKTAAFAREWISQHAGAPFFFFFHIFEPHVPWDPPEPFRARYGLTYEAEIATADAIVGNVLEHLRAIGAYEKSIVIVTSDHGEGLGDHGEDQHSILLYREAIHVPLFLKLPGERGKGSRITRPVQLSDIFPTVAASLGLSSPKEVTGLSLLAPDNGGSIDRVIYSETLYPRLQLGWSDLKSVANARYHYIHGPRPELYDMVSDPAERVDLVKDKRETAAQLARELLRFPVGNERPSAEDAETLKRLAALGYIGGLRDRSGAGVLPNPIDNLHLLSRMQEGWHMAARKENAKAISLLSEIVKESPGMSEVWTKLGELHAEEGNDESAAAAYRQVLGRSPVPLPDISIALGLIELRLRRPDEAERLASASLPSLPVKSHHLLARIAMARGDLSRAETEAKAAAEAGGAQPSELLLLAEIRLQAGRLNEALQDVERAEARARELRLPAVYNASLLRADILARSNRVAEAEAAFQAEIAAFPENGAAYSRLAVLQFVRGNRAEAARLLSEMVQRNPSGRNVKMAAGTADALGLKEIAASLRRGSSPRESKVPKS